VANQVKIKILIDDNGDLSVIAADAKKAASATDKLGKSTEGLEKKRTRFHKREKGVSQATSNSTKAFSKQAQTINGGSSSLVGAYATLAANVFALSATFNFFKRAADVSNLQKQQLLYAQSTGTALATITSNLRETSDGMLGFREAAQAAGIGMAKGFSPTQLENLAIAARKASTALGRDFGDAFDRLLRGVSKAEPELLDELGITLRLESATRRYAEALGVSADKLTESQRSQAVYVETMRQANSLFGQVEPQTNAFIRLSKTFEDMAKAGTELVLPFFEGFANMISSNMVAALTVFGAIATSIFSMMFSFSSVTKATEKYDEATTKALRNTQTELDKTKRAIKATEDSQKKAAKTAQNAAKRSGVKGGLVGKLASGKKMNQQQLGQTRAMLKRAEADFKAHGKVKSKILKTTSIKDIRTMRRALDLELKLSKKVHTQQIGFFKKRGMQAKRFYLSMKKRGISTFRAIGKAATMAGKAMNTAMKMAGIIGVFLMLWDVAKTIISSPFSIVKSILSAIDSLINKALSGLSNMVNDAPDWLKKMMGIKKGEVFSLGKMDLAGAFDSSGFGQTLNRFEQQRDATKQNKEALDDFRDSMKAMGTETTAIISGLNGLTGAAREKSVLSAMQSLDVAGSMRKASEVDALSGMDSKISRAKKKAAGPFDNTATGERDKEIAIKQVAHLEKLRAKIAKRAMKQQAELKKKFEDLGLTQLSPALATAVEKWSLKTAEELQTAATVGLKGIKELDDEIDNLTKSLQGGDLTNAEVVLSNLKNTAEQTATALEKSGEGSELAAKALATYSDAFGEFKGGTDAALASVIAHNEAVRQNNFLIAQQALLGKARKDIMAARNNADKAQLELNANIFAQSMKQKPEELLKLQRLEKELKLKLAIANAAVITEEQGSMMGSVAASAALMPTPESGDNAFVDVKRDENGEPIVTKDKEGNESYSYEKADSSIGEKAAQLGDVMSPQLEELKKLGPDGEYMASITEGALSMTESFSTAFETIKEKGLASGEGIAAALAAGSAVMQAMIGISQKQTKKRVSDIDKQIAAEKRSDGKSKESLARIKQMEKKKDDIKRKAFEKEKKMKLAQAVMATATGIMNAVGSAPFPFNIPFIAMAGAIGAMQIQAIRKSTYEGGGSAADAGAASSEKSSIKAGSRSNSVDLASSRSAVGELGYARGQEGVGNINNFTPAFTGARYRAAGGSAGYMVGEQGPELFLPDTPGTIVPAGDVSSAGGGSNVNISISAVDAAGVEQVLQAQRANIISMIRESANQVGETFLESVDTIGEGANY